MVTRYIPLLILLLWNPMLAGATESMTYDRVTLDASATQEVENDTLVAVFYFQSQGKDPARAAERVNRTIAWGVKKIKQYPEIRIQTQGYQTLPIYHEGKPTGIWRVQQSIRLESRDFDSIASLLGELQEKLAIRYLGYQLSADRRREVETSLIQIVITRFKQKAKLVAHQFGAQDFRLVSVNISSPGHRPPVMMRSMGAMEAKMATAPVVEAGEQEVRISAHGVIELVRE